MISGRAVDQRLAAGGRKGNRIAFHLEVLDLAVSRRRGSFDERAKLGGSPVDRLQLVRRDAVGDVCEWPRTRLVISHWPPCIRSAPQADGVASRRRAASDSRVDRFTGAIGFLSWRTEAGRCTKKSRPPGILLLSAELHLAAYRSLSHSNLPRRVTTPCVALYRPASRSIRLHRKVALRPPVATRGVAYSPAASRRAALHLEPSAGRRIILCCVALQ